MPNAGVGLRAVATAMTAAVAAVRLWSISDVHTDSPENRQWVEDLSTSDYRHDVLICAGDVSDDMDVLEETLRLFVERFGTVLFVPGNHDLWVRQADPHSDSWEKLLALRDLCTRLGVHTGPVRVVGPSSVEDQVRGIWVCPLYSWHHKGFDEEPDLQGWAVPPVERCMVDYSVCKWPGELSMLDDGVAEFVDKLNDEMESTLSQMRSASSASQAEEPLVTFSHFLPEPELLLEKRFLAIPPLPKASGSLFLQRRVRRLKPHLHVFGHTHFGWDMEVRGVRYVQGALCYPRERDMRPASIALTESLDTGATPTGRGFVPGASGPVLLWSSTEGFAPKMHGRWSAYYETTPREPERVFDLADYAASRFRKTDPRANVVKVDFSRVLRPAV